MWLSMGPSFLNQTMDVPIVKCAYGVKVYPEF